MTDRELLELAARAAGYEYAKYGGYIVVDGIPRNWNPLTDDGDALSLAVKLNIEFICDDEAQRANAGVWRASAGPNDVWDCLTPYNGDKFAATRRAIVRAAAEIGRKKCTTEQN